MNRRVFASVAAFAALTGFAIAADKTMTIEMYADAKAEFRWRMKDADGTIVATSGQGYKAKADCKTMVEKFKSDIGKYKFEISQDNEKKHRFSMIASNGQTVGSSSKGYDKKDEVEKVVEAIKKGAKNAKIKDETSK